MNDNSILCACFCKLDAINPFLPALPDISEILKMWAHSQQFACYQSLPPPRRHSLKNLIHSIYLVFGNIDVHSCLKCNR